MPSNHHRHGRKRKRVSQRISAEGEDNCGKTEVCDLNVTLVLDRKIRNNYSDNHHSRNTKNAITKRGSNEEHSALVQRLQSIGYSTIALSHSIDDGKIRPDRDIATKTIPSSLIEYVALNSGGVKKIEWTNKDFTILRRMNITIHESSQLSDFCWNSPNETLTEVLRSYELIAMNPRNDSSFSSICNMSNLFYCDIISLDYTSGRGGIQLPYKLRGSDIKAATDRGIVFELSYAPALTNPSKRKAFLQTARQFLNATLGVKDSLHQPPKLIISSGDRDFENIDHGIMALRSYLDMKNFAQIVLGFDDKFASDIFCAYSSWVVQRGCNRHCGKVSSGASIDLPSKTCKQTKFEVIDDSYSEIVESASGSKEIKQIEEERLDEKRVTMDDGDKTFDHDNDFLKF